MRDLEIQFWIQLPEEVRRSTGRRPVRAVGPRRRRSACFRTTRLRADCRPTGTSQPLASRGCEVTQQRRLADSVGPGSDVKRCTPRTPPVWNLNQEQPLLPQSSAGSVAGPACCRSIFSCNGIESSSGRIFEPKRFAYTCVNSAPRNKIRAE